MNEPSIPYGTSVVDLPFVRRATLSVNTIAILLTLVVTVGFFIFRSAFGEGGVPRIVFTVFFFYVVLQLILGWLDQPPKIVVGDTSEAVDVVVLVPAYNEDPEALRRCLLGFVNQTRQPDGVVVVDDGSTASDYTDVRQWFVEVAAAMNIRATWLRTVNQGKRHAQVAGMRCEPGADIYVTVDSDSILDRHALANSLPRFSDPKVQSVAAIVLTTNYRETLITRVMDLYCVGLQLFERSAFSRLSAVLVNSGGCALYRGDVIRDNITTYLSESVFGRPVSFSDDSMLTLFALLRGRAVQQSNAFVFTLMPTTFDHHRRQQVRWMRGSFIRSGWRFRFLRLTSWAYWVHLTKWVFFAVITSTTVNLALTGAFADPTTVLTGLLGGLALYTMTVARYLSIIRSDQSTWQRILTFATTPLACFWSLTFLRGLRWYAMTTFLNVGWGTRETVEVSIDSLPENGPIPA